MIGVSNPIGPRLIRSIILISTFFSIFATGIQLYSDYRGETHMMNIRLDQIKASSLDSLSLNLWQNNDKLINLQLKSLLTFPDITYASISEDDDATYIFGENLKEDSIEKKYPLVYTHNDKDYILGTLTLQAGLGQIRNKLKDKFFLIAITQSAKTFIVAFIILYLFSYMVTRHLDSIVTYIHRIVVDKDIKDLKLKGHEKDDELSMLCNTINILQKTISQKLDESEKSVAHVETINAVLNKRLKLQGISEDIQMVHKKDIEAIQKLLTLMEKSESEDTDMDLLKKDVFALNILFKRAFRQ